MEEGNQRSAKRRLFSPPLSSKKDPEKARTDCTSHDSAAKITEAGGLKAGGGREEEKGGGSVSDVSAIHEIVITLVNKTHPPPTAYRNSEGEPNNPIIAYVLK